MFGSRVSGILGIRGHNSHLAEMGAGVSAALLRDKERVPGKETPD